MFKIEIIGMDDFLKFVAIIKGEDLDAAKIKALTDGLNKDADTLIQAENAQEKT